MTKTILLLSLGLCISFITPSYADESESFSGWMFSLKRHKGVKPVDNESYLDECGACHFAYPPGLLPEQSWDKLLTPTALEDHFGENAELDADVLNPIVAYVKANSADKSYYKRSRKINYAIEHSDEAPLRITEVKYIKRKHHEIPEDFVIGNDDVQSFSNCNACHTKAEDGIFDDDTVSIPNHEDWED